MTGPDRFRLIPRKALALAVEALDDFRVVLINGPRQAGKTTLLRELHRERGGTLASLDDPDLLAAAVADPVSFVAESPKPLLIDEVQRAGDPLVRAVKVAVDRDPQPGRFVLTGSTQFLTVPTLSESLAGRVRIIDLWPLSQGELEDKTERFIDVLFEDPLSLRGVSLPDLSRKDYFRRTCSGGFPEALKQGSRRASSAWFESYVRTVTQRDIAEISQARELEEMPKLLRILAGLTSQELTLAQPARTAGMTHEMVRRYLALLETVYLIHRVPAWSRNLTAKVKRHPKVFLTDTGLAANLLGVSWEGLVKPVAPAAGILFETFAVNEVAKQTTWNEKRVNLHHFRNRDGAEVDLVLEALDGRVAGIEIKSAAVVGQQDFRRLALVRDKLGEAFVQGLVLYTGTKSLSFGDRLAALPLSILWECP